MRTALTAAVVGLIAGCAGPVAAPPATRPTAKSDPLPDESAGHSHDRGAMQLADFGLLHAGLTAHLSSKSGHELDVFVETAADPQPAAVPLTRLAGTATQAGVTRPVAFDPAPADERPPGEPAGACSHFVARVPWLDPDAPLSLTLTADLGGRPRTAVWPAFVPRQYAHHAD